MHSGWLTAGLVLGGFRVGMVKIDLVVAGFCSELCIWLLVN